MYKFLLTLVLTSFFLTNNVAAQSDVEGAEDHPLITRYPGSYIAYYDTQKFREYSLATGPLTAYKYIEQKETIGGALTRITYHIEEKEERVSLGEVYYDLSNAIKEEGLEILAKGYYPESNVKKEVGGGIWITIALEPNNFPMGSAAQAFFAGSSSSGGTFSIISKNEKDESIVYLAVYGERHSEDLIVYHFDILEEKKAEIGKVTVDAAFISDEIKEKGSIALYGITFAHDSYEIQSESERTLEQMATYLNNHKSQEHYIVGHTDMTGSFDYNMQLSQRRADAIRSALITKYGVNKDQVTAKGIGFLSPLATNETETGRSKNRRTELVIRP